MPAQSTIRGGHSFLVLLLRAVTSVVLRCVCGCRGCYAFLGWSVLLLGVRALGGELACPWFSGVGLRMARGTVLARAARVGNPHLKILID